MTKPGRFEHAWEQRHQLSRDALTSWDVTWDPHPRPDCEAHNWLTRDLVKVDCAIVDPAPGGKELASPYVVCLGSPQIANRFRPVSLDVVNELVHQIATEQNRAPADPYSLQRGELIDWRIAELKSAVRRGRTTSP